MSTTDINGLVYYETTDNVTPLQVVLNGISTAVTNAFDSTDRIFPVADTAARDALYTSRGAPLLVFREDAGVLERNGGAGWVASSIGPWTTYTPTVTGVSLGTGGTATGQWRREGDLIRCRVKLTWGSSASGSAPRVTLPVASIAPEAPFQALGLATLKAGTPIYAGMFLHASTTTVQINYLGVDGVFSNVTLTTPGAPSAGDTMSGSFVYRAA